MFKKFEFLIAFRYLKAKHKDGVISLVSWFSLIGIMLGVATLIVVMAVMNGYRVELMDRILGINGHINLYPIKKDLDLDYAYQKIKEISDVKFVAPLVTGQAMASSDYNSAGSMFRGMQKQDILNKKIIVDNIIKGNLDNFGSDKIIIGESLARNLGISVGSKLQLLVPKTTATVVGRIPRSKTFEVIALFNVGMYEYDNSTIFMGLKTAQLLNKLDDKIEAFELQVSNPNIIEDVAMEVIQQFPNSFYIQDWRQMNSSFFNAIEIERSVMFLILTLIILVASFNIISGLTMLVNEKNKQIAILRTMGATRQSIMRIFFICGSAIGVFGTLLGVALGLAFSMNIESIREFLSSVTGVTLFDPVVYFLSTLPAKLEMSDLTNVILLSVGLSFVATIFPAWKASTKDPAEAIRYE